MGCGHGPRRSAPATAQPRVIRHPIGSWAPGLHLGQERESCEAPGGSSRSRLVLALGCEAARQTAMARIVERNIHRRFLFSSSTNNLQLLSPDLTDLLYRFDSTRSSFHFKGISKDGERIRRPSRSACLRRFVKLVPLPWRVSDMSGDEKYPGVECHTSHFSKIFAR